MILVKFNLSLDRDTISFSVDHQSAEFTRMLVDNVEWKSDDGLSLRSMACVQITPTELFFQGYDTSEPTNSRWAADASPYYHDENVETTYLRLTRGVRQYFYDVVLIKYPHAELSMRGYTFEIFSARAGKRDLERCWVDEGEEI